MKIIQFLLVCLSLAAAANGCAYEDYRLPSHIRPQHYDLQLNVDTEGFTHQGLVKISLAVDPLPHKVPENLIVLHAHSGLAIEDIKFHDQTTESSSSRLGRLLHTKHEPNEVQSYCSDPENELLVITMRDKISKKTRGELEITFSGHISQTELVGFYHNRYADESRKAPMIVNTHFEADYARRALPCFDEPSFKATFDVALMHDSKLVALSNGAVESEVTEGEYMVSKFKRTPLMSTYLLAWAVGDLEYTEKVVSDGRLRIRAYALRGRVGQTKLALETGVRAIALMEEYFDVPFVMDKIDMVGLPIFKSGAVENWGLIFYYDCVFLFDEEHSKSASKGWVVSTVTHELAHQWFGNLVTMAWWNDLWLNEGFAAWMQNYFTDQLYPEFEWQHYWILNTHVQGLRSDANQDVHSIQVENVGRDLRALFNHIVYKKACEVLRHIHDDYLGPERFREGIRKYIKEHLYGNTQAEDLWGALTEVSGLPVDKLMKSWITQPGHPEVEVELLPSGELILRQQRHVPSGKLNPVMAKQEWMIPMSVIFADDKGNRNVEKLIMDSRELKVKVPEWFEPSNSNHWVKLNAGFKGFYRVKYSRDLIMRLEAPCRSKSLETADRLNLIYDFFTTPLPMDQSELVKVFDWFQEDHEGAILLMRDGTMKNLRENDQIQLANRIEGPLLDSYKSIYAKQGFKFDTSETSMTDANGLIQAFETLVGLDFEPIVKDALEMFDAEGNQANVNLRGACYMAVAKHGSQGQIDRLKQFYKEAVLSDEFYRTRRAMQIIEASN